MTNPTATIFLPYHALDEVIVRGTRAAQPAADGRRRRERSTA